MMYVAEAVGRTANKKVTVGWDLLDDASTNGARMGGVRGR
jgi:hypothetical protein